MFSELEIRVLKAFAAHQGLAAPDTLAGAIRMVAQIGGLHSSRQGTAARYQGHVAGLHDPRRNVSGIRPRNGAESMKEPVVSVLSASLVGYG